MYQETLRLPVLRRSLLFFCASLVLAQEATMVGTVTDQTGAMVPNASITITNLDKNQSRQMKSNEAGQFVVADLLIGHYTVRAEASGFKVAEQKNITLNVGDRDRIDLKLEIGNTQESVTVEAAAIAVQSESGEVSSVITGQQVSQLATNGRS